MPVSETNAMINTDDISSAILAAAVVAKSDLSGKELEDYAISVQQRLLRNMQKFRERHSLEKA